MNENHPPRPDLSVDLNGLRLSNPVIGASGTFGYGLEYADHIDLNQLGGFATKGLSLNPRVGNPVPRVIETASGMLNAIGLENIGLDRFLLEKLPLLHSYQCRILVNFFGNTIEEYAEMAERLSGVGRVDALEMNISCPNVKEGGLEFSSDPAIVEKVVRAARGATQQFLIVKLSPNVKDISEVARAAEAAGADALSVANTYVGMKIDIHTRKPYLANKTGGLSGPAIKPLTLNLVYRTARAVSIPVIGIGGIVSAEDALEYFLAGACAVQVGTGNFIDPRTTLRIAADLEEFFLQNGIRRLADFKMAE